MIYQEISKTYNVRILDKNDIDTILKLYVGNPLFFEHGDAEATEGQVLSDMTLTPPGIEASKKYFVGFFDGCELVAVMDLIDGYPKEDIAYVGLFMMRATYQGKGIGSQIVSELIDGLTGEGKTAIRLAIDKGNPQSTHFWEKCGFRVIDEVMVRGHAKLVAERVL